jgi:aryl-alcohol dehydrogenase-like predicted oxidoreductase
MAEKWATAAGTEKFFHWNPIDPSKRRSFEGLTLSALGAGAHLGIADEATDRMYEQSLVQAALSGINCFDTSIHDRCQRSERVLKRVLKELGNRGIFREQLFISTKGGPIPSEGAVERTDEYLRTQLYETGVIEPKEVIGEIHCMSPAFLEHQIQSSLKNLGLECIDLYYLQNPEIELIEAGESEFYRRLVEAFRLFEKKVQERKIRFYGLATWNGFRQKKLMPGLLNLAKVLECAKEVGGEEHHFKAIQLPYNLVMLEALKVKNQGSATILQAAKEARISVFVSSCLMQSQVAQLPQRVYEKLPLAPTSIVKAIEFVLSTPGICAAYAGMKKLEHLMENGRVLKEPIWPKELWQGACSVLGLKI